MIEDGIVALIGHHTERRIYPVVLPASPELPSLTYQTISSVSDYTNDGPTGLVKARLQIDAWAATYGEAKTLTVSVRAALDNFTGELPNGVPVASIARAGSLDGYEKYSELYRVQTDWLIIYGEN